MSEFPIGALFKTDLRLTLHKVETALAERPARRIVVYFHKKPIWAAVTLADLEALRALSELSQAQLVAALGSGASPNQLKPFFVLLEWLAREAEHNQPEETSSDGDETEDED